MVEGIAWDFNWPWNLLELKVKVFFPKFERIDEDESPRSLKKEIKENKEILNYSRVIRLFCSLLGIRNS